jgi:hypothetical protein
LYRVVPEDLSFRPWQNDKSLSSLPNKKSRSFSKK